MTTKQTPTPPICRVCGEATGPFMFIGGRPYCSDIPACNERAVEKNKADRARWTAAEWDAVERERAEETLGDIRRDIAEDERHQ